MEIRDLEAKLRQAYVNRALAVQIAQKEVAQKREKELREAEHQVFYAMYSIFFIASMSLPELLVFNAIFLHSRELKPKG